MTTATQKAATETKAIQVYRVYIKATPQAIWDAITQPEFTRRFGYGGDAEYDLRPGGSYRGMASAEMRSAGGPEVAVDGEIIEIDPPRKLVQTWRMLMDESMAAEGFTRLTYELTPYASGTTTLTVTHDLTGAPRLAAVLGGEHESQGAGGGWAYTLSGLKTLLETGEQLNWPA